jgi:hypothetical protein
MSMIHSSSALLGRRSALMAGTARCRTVRSMTYSTHARAITARPIHSLRPALGGGEVSVSRCIGCLRLSAVTGCGPPAAPELIGGGRLTPSRLSKKYAKAFRRSPTDWSNSNPEAPLSSLFVRSRR